MARGPRCGCGPGCGSAGAATASLQVGLHPGHRLVLPDADPTSARLLRDLGHGVDADRGRRPDQRGRCGALRDRGLLLDADDAASPARAAPRAARGSAVVADRRRCAPTAVRLLADGRVVQRGRAGRRAAVALARHAPAPSRAATDLDRLVAGRPAPPAGDRGGRPAPARPVRRPRPDRLPALRRRAPHRPRPAAPARRGAAPRRPIPRDRRRAEDLQLGAGVGGARPGRAGSRATARRPGRRPSTLEPDGPGRAAVAAAPALRLRLGRRAGGLSGRLTRTRCRACPPSPAGWSREHSSQ